MKYYATVGGHEHEFTFRREGGRLVATRGDRTFAIDLSLIGDGSAFSLIVDGRSHDVMVDAAEGRTMVQVAGELVEVEVVDERERTAHQVAGARAGGKRTVTSSMPGVVVEVLVAVGDAIADGQTLLILEAMKMQNPILAEGAGKVGKLHVAAGQAIGAGAALVDLDE